MSTSSFSFSAEDDGESKPRSKRRIQKKPRRKGKDREDLVIRGRPPRRDFEDDDFTYDEDDDSDLDVDIDEDEELEDLDEDFDLEEDDFL